MTGPGRAYFERYYFDENKRDCLKFVYGGMCGNPETIKAKKANRFYTYEQCMKTCKCSNR